jgi:hypothetical protein
MYAVYTLLFVTGNWIARLCSNATQPLLWLSLYHCGALVVCLLPEYWHKLVMFIA